MARTGVYFSDVKKARDQLVAQGRHPSIDAIRAALGDTGSKTTIHKYMREIEAEDGAKGRSVSDAILTLTTQLADQLKREAVLEVEVIRTEMAELRKAHDAHATALKEELAALQRQLDDISNQLATSESNLATTEEQLHLEQIARHTAEQRAVDLNVRLNDARDHQLSLEDKHRHARDALEHFRTASKEQREQESRRHEQQVHAVQAELRQAQLAFAGKSEELTRLNKEAAGLANELAANKEALFRERETVRNMTWKVAQLPVAESRIAVLENQLTESRARLAEAEQAGVQANALCSELRQEKAALDIALARSNSTAKSTSALEERLAKLDQAVFGAKEAAPPAPGN
jgi:predicted  nucleic acid-binding Zn-ribbon protein